MNIKTRGIVIKRIPYSDNKLILHLFTKDCGRISSIVQVGKSMRSKYKRHLSNPLQLLDVDLVRKNDSGFYQIREFKHAYIFKSISSDVRRASIAMYLIEFFNKTTQGIDVNVPYFKFCWTAIQSLDQNAKVENLHLYIITKALRYMGLQPSLLSKEKEYFDIVNAGFVKNVTQNCLNELNSNILRCILSSDSFEALNLSLKREQRSAYIESIERYWAYHFEGFKPSKSLKVLELLWD